MENNPKHDECGREVNDGVHPRGDTTRGNQKRPRECEGSLPAIPRDCARGQERPDHMVRGKCSRSTIVRTIEVQEHTKNRRRGKSPWRRDQWYRYIDRENNDHTD